MNFLKSIVYGPVRGFSPILDTGIGDIPDRIIGGISGRRGGSDNNPPRHKGVKILIYDNSAPTESDSKASKKMNKWLQAAWRTGASLRSDFDYKIGAKSWDSVFEQIGQIRQRKYIKWIEFWGHGDTGCAFIGKDELDKDRFLKLIDRYNIKKSDFVASKNRRNTPLIWFRTCYTANGETGKKFLEAVAKSLDVYAYGHSERIDFFHGGLRCYCKEDGQYKKLPDGLTFLSKDPEQGLL